MFPFGVVSQGVRAVSDKSDLRRHMPGSSSNRQRGCWVALLGEYRNREVPKLVLLEERDTCLLFFLILV